MSLVLAALGLVLITLPHAVPNWTDVQRTSRWSITGTWLGLRLLGVAAGLTAAPTALRALGIHSMADACHRLASPAAPGSVAGSLATAAAAALIAKTLYVRARIRGGRARTRIESPLGTHRPHAAHPDTELVIVPTAEWLAYSVPGHPNQIVVSDGVCERLSGAELDALLAHEAAHLRLGHHRGLRILAELDGVAGAWARWFTDRVRLLLERAADEESAMAHGTRAIHGALCAGAETGRSPAVAIRRAALLSPASGHVYPVLPIAVACATAASVVVFTASAAAADHGVWGLVGICGGGV